MIVFSVIAVPTTFFGAVPGVYKIVVGVIVGILLDLAYTIKKPVALKIIIGGLVGAISWWMATFLIWTAFGYPFVTGMSNLLNNFIDMTWLISVPISHINGDFLLFIIFCGLLSSIQSIFFSAISYPIAQIIKKTAIYDRFTSFR